MIQVFVFDYRPISKRWVFGNHGFLKSKFSYLTIGQYQKDRCLQISDFSKSNFSYLTMGENWKVGFIKAGEKNPQYQQYPRHPRSFQPGL